MDYISKIKLADFGFAKYTEDNTFLTSYCGTPITMAPEVLKRFDEYLLILERSILINVIYGRWEL